MIRWIGFILMSQMPCGCNTVSMAGIVYTGDELKGKTVALLCCGILVLCFGVTYPLIQKRVTAKSRSKVFLTDQLHPAAACYHRFQQGRTALIMMILFCFRLSQLPYATVQAAIQCILREACNRQLRVKSIQSCIQSRFAGSRGKFFNCV